MTNMLSPSLRLGAAIALLATGLTASQAFAAEISGSASGTPAPGTMTPVNKSTPEFDAFRKTWDSITNYSATIVSHETTNDGKETQNRTFTYKFVKPTAALITIIAGPGKGGGAAWHGGPKIKGRQGGFISFVRLTIPKNDPRATSLRGEQIEVASFGFQLDHFATVPGVLSETKTPDGMLITLTPKAPEPSGVTKETMTLSTTTHLPVKREMFVGDKIVESGTYTDLKLNDPNLKDSNIDV